MSTEMQLPPPLPYTVQLFRHGGTDKPHKLYPHGVSLLLSPEEQQIHAWMVWMEADHLRLSRELIEAKAAANFPVAAKKK